MQKRSLILVSLAMLALALGSGCKRSESAEIEYRYAKIERGNIVRSISASGQVKPLTSVDIRSRAGGKVIQLLVEQGAQVKKGDVIAKIDTIDMMNRMEVATADLSSAQAELERARTNASMQKQNTSTEVQDAQVALELAKTRLAKAEEQFRTQPKLTTSSIQNAEAALASREADLREFKTVTDPQRRTDVQGQIDQTRAALSAAESEARRQQDLFEKGYVSLSAVERAQSNLASAQTASRNAQQRLATLEQELLAQKASLEASVRQAEASLAQARANQSNDVVSARSLDEARKAVRQAELALQRAQTDRMTVNTSQAQVQSARASVTRSRSSWENAKMNLDETTVVAPRDGVVTVKYLEEGTIIPPGTSSISNAPNIVQISDTTRLFVDCAVDEADIGQVMLNQKVRVLVEAFPGQAVEGKVVRIDPVATTVSNVTAIQVRVEVLPGYKIRILPGMNATCEFITLEKNDVILAPSQAVKMDAQGAYVLVEQKGAKPVRRPVKVGERGNDGIEVLEGLAEGDSVVVAEINMAQIREIQEKMQAAQQGGGLAGGGGRAGGGGGGMRGGGGGGGGGARPSGGGGGGGR
ncbi:MAG TPA: efflux RND transporter periplasmic adaptor subunit [Fimbriimonadaceae bacterium]|nr:efflux RND transporter periplasmic adaptor subunit [Fimbriimonadaceae bacterium]